MKMKCKISEMRDKQVVCVNSGVALGPVCDVMFDTVNGTLTDVIVFGRPKYLGLFGRTDDIIIPWCEIKVIGPDTILVGITAPDLPKRSWLFSRRRNR